MGNIEAQVVKCNRDITCPAYSGNGIELCLCSADGYFCYQSSGRCEYCPNKERCSDLTKKENRGSD